MSDAGGEGSDVDDVVLLLWLIGVGGEDVVFSKSDVGWEMGGGGEIDGGDVETGEAVGLALGEGRGFQVSRQIAEPRTGRVRISNA